MNRPPRSASFKTTIKCSSCAAEVDLNSMSQHACTIPPHNSHTTQAPAMSFPSPTMSTQSVPLRRPKVPFVPKIDPFAIPISGPFAGELTPASSHGSIAASPVSAGSGRQSPMYFPTRKASVPIRRPPSPELLSQDCAFPAFPVKPKPKRQDSQQNYSIRSRTKTPDGSTAGSVRSFDMYAKRSASLGAMRARSRQETADSRPSTASSSRRNSRDGITSDAPPMPPMSAVASRVFGSSDEVSASATQSPSMGYSQSPQILSAEPTTMENRPVQPITPSVQDEWPTFSRQPSAPQANNTTTFESMNLFKNKQMMNQPTREPSYKAKRPPPIVRPQPYNNGINRSSSMLQSSKTASHERGGSSLGRTLTGLFRKASAATRSKVSTVKPPMTDGPRHAALSAEPEQSLPSARFFSPNFAETISPLSQPSSYVPSPNYISEQQDPIVNHEKPKAEVEDLNRSKHDTVQIQEDFERALEAVPPSVGLSKIEEREEVIRRASVDSASSYGSVGFSRSSSSSHSTNPTDTLSQDTKCSAGNPSQTGFNFKLPSISHSPVAELRPDSPTAPLIDEDKTLPIPVPVEEKPEYKAEIEPVLKPAKEERYSDAETKSYNEATKENLSSELPVELNVEVVKQDPEPEIPVKHVPELKHEVQYSDAQRIARLKERLRYMSADFESIPKLADNGLNLDAAIGQITKPAEAGPIPKVIIEPVSGLRPKSPNSQPALKWPEVISSEPSPEFQPSSTPDIQVSNPPESRASRSPRSRRPSTPGATKGICRGCSRVILGSQKSVSSKDGRLSGRYHKECFTCTTCKAPFATADFYVYENQPYCAHHYHTVNNTLCTACGKGIEGQYMETSSVSGMEAKKFHPQCLTCTTCKIRLYNDYFEFNGKVYCEKDAFRIANSPKIPYNTAPARPSPLNREYISSGEPGAMGLTGGRFPERRVTRLMMTY